MSARLNVVYFVCHDLGRQLGCHGREVLTPRIDRFAAESLRFDQAFCSTAVCSPSRAACLTGRPAHQNGMMGLSHFGWRIRDGVRTVVDYFNEAGYETVHCGLSHEGEENFSRYRTDFEVSWRSVEAHAAVDDAISWLRARKKCGSETPFYLNIGTIEAHPSVWRKDFDAPGLPGRLHRDYGGPVPAEETRVPGPTPDIPLTRDEFGRFESAIRFLDREFGRLMDAIEVLGLSADTLVIFTTDHGMNDWRGKGCLYDRGMETALLVRPPRGTGAPGVTEHLVTNLDLTPTLLDACGVARPDGLAGRSFWPLLKEERYEPNEQVFLEWNFGGPQDDYSPARAIRTRTHKLIRNFGPHNFGLYARDEITPGFTREKMMAKRFKDYGPPYQHPVRMLPEYELYDLRADPHELDNLLARPGASSAPGVGALRDELAGRLDAWMRETGDHVLRGEIPRIPAAPGFHYQ